MILGNESVGEEDLFDDIINDSDTNNSNNADQSIWLEDLSWRVMKVKLEEANTRRFLKAKPRFLPYAECRAWVKAWGRWDSERDWYVSHTSYIKIACEPCTDDNVAFFRHICLTTKRS